MTVRKMTDEEKERFEAWLAEDRPYTIEVIISDRETYEVVRSMTKGRASEADAQKMLSALLHTYA